MDIEKLTRIVESEVRKALSGEADLKADERLNSDSVDAKNVLVLFTGGHARLQEALAQVELIIKAGYNVSAVLSESAVRVITPDLIRKIAGTKEVICEPNPSVSSIALIQNSIAVVIPILTRNSTAKIASGIADTLVTNLIQQALIVAKPVVAAKNSADPDLTEDVHVSMPETPLELNQIARNHLQKLASFGVKLVDVTEIAQTLINIIENRGVSLERKLITQNTIDDLPEGTKQMRVTRGTIVTPLAKDTARERGIDIIVSEG